MSQFSAFLVLLTLLTACDGDALRDNGGSLDAGTAVGAAGASAVDSAGAHGAGIDGTFPQRDAAPSDPMHCEVEAPPAAEEIEITIQNGRTEVIRLGNPVLCQREYFKVASVSDPARQWEGINCRHSCTGTSLSSDRCQADCPKPDPLPIEPGNAFTVTWAPLLYQRVLLLPQCCAQPSGVCSRECYVPYEAAAGPYTLTMILSDEHGNLLEQVDSPIELGAGDVSVVIE